MTKKKDISLEEDPVNLAKKTRKPREQTKPIKWDEFNALLVSYPSKESAAAYLDCSDTHLDNELMNNFGLTWTEYKTIRLQDVVSKVKAAMIAEAMGGDVPAGKYVLSNIGDWSDKTEVKNSNTNMTLEEFLKLQSDKLKEGK